MLHTNFVTFDYINNFVVDCTLERRYLLRTLGAVKQRTQRISGLCI